MSKRVVHITTVHRLHDPRIYYKQVATLAAAGFDVHLIAHGESAAVSGAAVSGTKAGVGQQTDETRASAGTGQDADAPYQLHLIGNRDLAPQSRGALASQALALAESLQADLYHIHDPELLPILKRLAVRTGARVVYDMHENYRARGVLTGPIIRAVERWAFRWLDHVVIADESYESIVARSGCPFTPILNYPLSPDAAIRARDRMAVTAAEARLLYTGVIARSRGLMELLDVADRLSDHGQWALDLVGICNRAADRAASEERIGQSANLQSMVRRVGWDQYVDAKLMRPFLEAASVGMILLHPHPNYVDVLPTKLFEYLQYGLPVICSDFPRLREFVEAHQCGAVVNPADVEGIVRIVRKWADDDALYALLSRNALETSRQFSWDTMGARLVDLYRELL